MRLRRVSWADAALTQPFQQALSSRRGVWATLLCSPAACQTHTGVNVGRLSLLFLMMSEHNAGVCSPKEVLTVGNWGEESEAGLYIKFPVMPQVYAGLTGTLCCRVSSYFLHASLLCLCPLPSLSHPHIPSHFLFFFFFYICIDIVLKGDTDGSFKKENHTLQEQVSHFKKELQQAHDE